MWVYNLVLILLILAWRFFDLLHHGDHVIVRFNLWTEILGLMVSAMILGGTWVLAFYMRKNTILSQELKDELVERKEMESHLRTLYSRRTLVEHAVQEGIWDWDVKRRRVHVSKTFQRLLGIPEGQSQDVKPRFFMPYIHPSQKQLFSNAIDSLLKDGSKLDMELRFKHQNEFYWYLVKGEAIYDNYNRITRLVGTLTDITERHDRELFIELDNELLKSITGAVPLENTLDYFLTNLPKLSDNLQGAILFFDQSGNQASKYQLVAPYLSDEFKTAILENTTPNGWLTPDHQGYKPMVSADLNQHNYQTLGGHMKKAGFVSVWSTPLVDISGLVLGVFEIFSEIRIEPTARDLRIMEESGNLLSRILVNHREEQSIMQIQSMFQTIFEQAAVGVALIHSNTGQFLQVNDKFCEMMEITPNKFLATRFKDIVAPEDYHKLEENLNKIHSLDLREFVIELQLTSAERGAIWVEIHASAIMHAERGNPTCVTIIQDITERKFVEDNLYFHSEVLENLDECVMIMDAEDQSLLYTNAKFKKLFGYSQKEALKMTFVELFPSTAKATNQIRKIRSDLHDRGKWKGEMLNQKKDGRVFDSNLTISRYEHPKFGKTWISVCDDITMLKEAEDSIRKIDKLNSIGVLAGGIAHDFNNVLVGVFANLSMIKERVIKDRIASTYLDDAIKAMGRAKALTSQLLTFSKGGEPIKEHTEITTLIREVVLFDLSGSNVKPSFDIQEGLWKTKVDKGQIQQVFSNLTINAKQAMDHGGILRIKVENYINIEENLKSLAPGPYIQISFSDSGDGIAPELLDQIFDPYFSTKKHGSGLGLTTTFSIVNKHGGHISVDSSLGQGTTFHVFLPAHEEVETEQAYKVQMNCPPVLSGTKVLIMDDQEIILKSLGRMLELEGFKVGLARDGDEAIVKYKLEESESQGYDLVIMDLTIPGGKGGREAIQTLKEINPAVKAIVSSGYADDPAMASYKEYGFKGVVPKPFVKDELLEEIQRVLCGC